MEFGSHDVKNIKTLEIIKVDPWVKLYLGLKRVNGNICTEIFKDLTTK